MAISSTTQVPGTAVGAWRTVSGTTSAKMSAFFGPGFPASTGRCFSSSISSREVHRGLRRTQRKTHSEVDESVA